MTRLRNDEHHVATPLQAEYYRQRSLASGPGTLLFVESLAVSRRHGGMHHGGGLWSDEQVAAWKRATDAVHDATDGAVIFAQLFAFGRAADPTIAAREGFDVVAASAIPITKDGGGDGGVGAVAGDVDTGTTKGAVAPRALTLDEIQQTVRDYAQAARNAMRAGFDGVEIMAGYGYLLDSFLQDVTNKREDAYGGSIENRSRLLHEVMKAVVEAVGGPERVGVRLSPWSTFQGMGMVDPIPQFSDVVLKAKDLNLAFIHLIEARVSGFDDVAQETRGQNMEFAYNLWRDGTFLAAGVMFGRHFTSNPDLVFKIKHGLPLTPYRRDKFYYTGSLADPEEGYTTFAVSKEFKAAQEGTKLDASPMPL
ncbi:hypothetical protein PG996_010465 [Apiospora saccharicola]|uniref:NADH:flavin oxidoreductase/NADH oxidase N-terminal domain-containing protein n=1 Tax=Apiospora saccharicola TaxID=335842 RepID=A0ABR1UNN3_9PEZI